MISDLSGCQLKVYLLAGQSAEKICGANASDGQVPASIVSKKSAADPFFKRRSNNNRV